jgi:hypothetical protein
MLVPVVVAYALTGCATDERLSATRVLTVATAGDVVLVGFSSSLGTRGSFELASVHGQPMTCRGRFSYRSPPRGIAAFECSNGESGEARIEAGPGLSGEGAGDSSMGPVRIVYGYSLNEINDRMAFPGGRRLTEDHAGIGLMSAP